MNPQARGDIWLGDALRAAREMHADDAALASILRCLGLHSPPANAQALPLPDAFQPPPQRPERDASATDENSQPRVPAPEAALGEDYRLPSTLDRLPAQTQTPPAWLEKAQPLRMDSESPPMRAAPPLLPHLQRRSLLSAALASHAEDGAPDLRRIVQTLGRGRVLRRVPRLTRRTLRHGVEVHLDNAPWMRPYQEDQRELLAYLPKLMPPGRVRVVTIKGQPAPVAAGAPPTPVLLLSDLGTGYQPQALAPGLPAAWQGFANALRRQGRHAVALLPYASPRWPRVSGMALLYWHEGLNLSEVRRARARPAARAPSAGVSQEAVLELAKLLSPALQINRWHLRSARVALHLDVGAEADLCFSELAQSWSRIALVLDPAIAQELRAELQGGGRLESALALLRQAHDRAHADAERSLLIEEELTALELRGQLDDEGAEAALQPALKALAGRDDEAGAEDVAVWAAHAWTRFSPALRATAAARQVAFAAAGRLDTRGWLVQPGGERPALPADAAWLLAPQQAGTVAMSVELRRYGDGSTNLVIGPVQPATNALHRIDLPRTTPIWLQVTQRSGSGEPAELQTVAIDANASTQIDVDKLASGTLLLLQDMAGTRWQMAAAPTLRQALRGVVLTPADSRMQRAAVVLDERLALLPQGHDYLSGKPLSPDTVVQFVNPEGGVPIEARVLGDIAREFSQFSPLPLNVVELALPAGRTRQTAPWRALDLALRAPVPDDIATGEGALPCHVFVALPREGPLADESLRRTGEGSYELLGTRAAESLARLATTPTLSAPGLLAPCDGSAWSMVFGVQRNQHASARPPERLKLSLATLERLHQAALALADRRWKGLLLSSPDEADMAHRLRDALVGRMGSTRIAYDPDGRLLADPDKRRRTLDECTVFIVIGSRNPGEWMGAELLEALGAGKRLLWVPLSSPSTEYPEVPSHALRDWPEAARNAAMASWAFWRDYQDILTRRDGKPDLDRIAEHIVSWSPDAARSPIESAPSAAPLPATAPPRSFATSLRARFAKLIERMEATDLGLFQVDLSNPEASGGLRLKPARTSPAEGPMLLFIHAAMSNTAGSFGGLLDTPNVERARLVERYGERIYSWQHRSVTVGPVSNTLALLRVLPEKAHLHIVGLSAGGVQGELLCLGQLAADAPLDQVLKHLPSDDSASVAGDATLQDLRNFLVHRPSALRIERFVRVACPAGGTAIHERSMDRSLGLLKLTPVVGTALSLLPGLDRLLSDPQASPGLSALLPGAAVPRLLNSGLSTTAALTVVAGVARRSSLLGRIGHGVTRFLLGNTEVDDDLLVPLASAFGGLERTGGVDYLIDEGEDVSHFNFFNNLRTRRAVVDALLTTGTPEGFSHADSLAALRQQRFGAAAAEKATPA